jgi:CheY-like chemotaxis protein
MVVDDATTVRMFFRAVLGKDREVVEARDGLEALEMMPELDPAIVFLDINMPGMDGYEVLRRVRERDETARVPVVMCSTETKPIDETQAYRAGANFYVRKPVPKDVLRNLTSVLAPRGDR